MNQEIGNMAIQQCACTIGLSIEFAAANETICCNFEVPVAAIQHAQDAAAAFIASTVMAVKKGMDAEKREAVAKRAAIEKERALKRERVEEVVGTGTQTTPPPPPPKRSKGGPGDRLTTISFAWMDKKNGYYEYGM